MKATVTENCSVAPNGYDTVQLQVGQEISGELAAFCVRHGHAKPIDDEPPKQTPAPKITKPAKPRHKG